MVETILEVSHLSVRREGRAVVEDVSFALRAESDTALVGPNGAGKSTLVQAIVGVLPHHGGSVRLLGHPLGPRGQLPPALRNQVAFLPQTLTLQGRLPLTVAEFVGLGWDPPGPALPWQAAGERARAVREALAKVDAAALAPRLFSDLSAGQQKRVLLAFCVVRPRRLLILDEAQAGLDPRAGERFHALLYQLRRSEGWTILQVSHDLDMVRRTCDTVLCLNRSLRCAGSPEHALSPQQLERLYGRGYVPYLHHHHAAGAPSPAP